MSIERNEYELTNMFVLYPKRTRQQGLVFEQKPKQNQRSNIAANRGILVLF